MYFADFSFILKSISVLVGEYMKLINFSNKNLGHSNFCAEVLPQLSTNPLVEELLLSGNQLSSSSIKELATQSSHLSALDVLELSNNHLGHVGLVNLLEIFRSMSPASALTFLGLAHNDIRDVAMESLSLFLGIHFPKLQTLDLRNNLITDAGIDKLIPAIKKYSSFRLYISGNYISGPKIAELKEIAHLTIDIEVPALEIHAPEPKPMSPNPDWVLLEQPSPQELSRAAFDAMVPVRDGTPYVFLPPPTPSPSSSPLPA